MALTAITPTEKTENLVYLLLPFALALILILGGIISPLFVKVGQKYFKAISTPTPSSARSEVSNAKEEEKQKKRLNQRSETEVLQTSL